MDGQQYLNQITPTAQKDNGILGIFKSKIGILLIAGVILTLAIIIIGSAMKPQTTTPADAKTQTFTLKNQFDVISNSFSTHQKNLHSPTLRSISAEVSRILSDSNKKFTDQITTELTYTAASITDDIVAVNKSYYATLDSALFAEVGGPSYDRAFARKMAMALKRFLDAELSIYNLSQSDDLKNILSSSYNSLSPLYVQLNNYSE